MLVFPSKHILPKFGLHLHTHRMPLLNVKCDVDAAVERIRSLQRDQLPYILALSLTRTAKAAQEDVQALERSGIFQLRNDWTVRNTKIVPATKQSLTAEVYTDTENRTTGAPDYLKRQQEGGDKIPVAGRDYLAIPTKYLWKYTPKNRPLPDNLRPKALLPANAPIGTIFRGSFSAGTRGDVRRVISKRTLSKLSSSQFEAFTQKTRNGSLCIFVRHGGIKYHGATHDAEPWFVLTKHARIRARFPMDEAVKRSVEANFSDIFVATAKEIGVTVSA